MSRKKQAIARRWESIEAQREKENQPIEEKKEEKQLSDGEHKNRLEVLKELGLLK